MKISFALFILLSILNIGGQANAQLASDGNECPKVAGDKNKWVYFVKDERHYHCYNQTELHKTESGIIGVWVKLMPRNQKVIDHFMLIRRNNAFLMEGYDDFQYIVIALEIDCLENKSALIEQRDYGKDGRVLDRVRTPLRNWQEIGTNSYHDLYKKVLCKKEINKK